MPTKVRRKRDIWVNLSMLNAAGLGQTKTVKTATQRDTRASLNTIIHNWPRDQIVMAPHLNAFQVSKT